MIRRVDDTLGGERSVDPARSGASPDDDRAAAEAVARAARRVLEIVPGERRLLPEFGCRIHALGSLRAARDRDLAAGLVEEALERWAPHLEVDRAEVWPAGDPGWIRVAIRASGRWHELEIRQRAGRSGPPEPAPRAERPRQARGEPAA